MQRFRHFFRGDAMDDYLGKLGLARKATAKDNSSLFRVVSEQVRAVIGNDESCSRKDGEH